MINVMWFEKCICVERVIFQILLHVVKNVKHTRSIIEDSVIMCDEIMDATKTVLTNKTSTKTIPRILTKKR